MRKLCQIVLLGFLDDLDSHVALLEPAQGRCVACRHRNHHVRRLLNERPEKLRFDFGLERDIEQQQRHRRPASHRRGQRLSCGFEQGSPITGAGLVQEDVDAIQQGGKVRSATRQSDQISAGYSSKSQVEQCTRQRLRKAWRLGDRREILQRVIATGLERGARRNGFVP